LAPTARADNIFFKLDNLGTGEDLVVILKLIDPDGSNSPTTKAIVVDFADIFLSSEANPYGITFVDGSDGVVIIESNDYNFGSENYLIEGAQVMVSTETVTGTGINLDRNTGLTGGSADDGTQSFTSDNDVIKFVDIGFLSTTISTQNANLSFEFSVKDVDSDATSSQTLDVTIYTGAVTGTADAESIQRTAGNDSLSGDGGNDIIRGGAGDDTIDGGTGNDLLDFSDASGAINFTLQQGAGPFTVAGGATPGLGQDEYGNMEGVIGSASNDTLTGSTSNDIIKGGDGTDTLNGGDGNDTLDGGGGNDTLNGGNNDDVLAGGAGADSLTGGSGNDKFVYGSVSDAGDAITDFSAVDDDLAFSWAAFNGDADMDGALDAGAFLSGAGVTAATDPGHRFILNTTDDTLRYDADGSGGGASILIADINDVPLTSADIIFIA
jgi:Ca2+-binding RTX toxin-like protein